MKANLLMHKLGIAILLACVMLVTDITGQTAAHTSSYFYASSSTVTVTNSFSYPDGSVLTYFWWAPRVPTGWSWSNVKANTSFMIQDGTISFNDPNSLPNPVLFSYDVVIPSGETLDQIVQARLRYRLSGGRLTYMWASPDPLILRQPRSIDGFVFHENTANGIYDVGVDTAVTNISVYLLAGGTTNRLDQQVTDQNGYYSFGGLPDGSFDLFYGVQTNKVTILPGGTDTNRNQLVPKSDRIIAVNITSATNVHVNVGMIGEAPMSSSISMRAYKSAEGIFIEFATENEVEVDEGNSIVVKRRMPDGTWIELGRASPQGSGSYNYRIQVPEGLLDLDGPNTIGIRDEVGEWHQIDGVTVSDFKANLLKMTKAGMLLTWNSLPDATYDIYRATRLDGKWELVAWECATNTTCSTIVRVEPDKPTCFFKIVMRR